MKCPRCEHENRAGAKFCEQCAFALNRHCSQCREPLPAAAKFCPACAHPAAAIDSPTDRLQASTSTRTSGPAGDGERRQATLLAADICGYSALCTKLDAEQVQALLGRFYDITDSIVGNYGGHIIDHAGDATLAVFGAPVAHDNDAERAVRAALDMHAQAAQVTDPLGDVLRLHVGIASGEVVAATITGGAQPKYSVTGDAANLSARLNALAQAGDTLVTDAVFRDVGDKIQAHSLGDVAVKGFDKPIGVWRIQDLRRGPAERRPFVGRQTEMRQLLSIAEGIAESNSGAAVLIRGDAGIGKSRLLEQLRHAAVSRGFACHVGHVLDFGVAKGQDAIPAIVKDVLEISAHAEAAVRRDAIERGVQDGLLGVDEVIFINDVLEVDHNAEQRARFHALDSTTRVRRTGETIVALLERACAVRPRVVAIEDVHWASPDLLRYLALLTRAASSNAMLLVMTSRFEGDPLDRLWRGSTHGSALMTIDLGPLRMQDAKLLAGGLFETSNVLAITCIERAEGNPLFLEQLLRSVLESEAMQLPATIQSLVLARMDRLSARDKAALQVASVIGKRFPLLTLQALAADATYRCNALIEADLVRPDGDDFLFAHALIQEGVYSSLLNSRKRELHRKAADWYGDTELIVRAEHLQRAGDPGAARAYLLAAQDQTRKFRHTKALELSESGIALYAAAGTESASPDGTHCALALLRGELLRELGRSEESIAAFRAARALATEDRERYRAWMGIVAGNRITGDIEVAMQALDEADAIAQKLGVAVERSRVHHTRGNLFFAIGNVDACCAQHEAALLSAEQAGDAECKAQALSGLGDANYAQGRALSAIGFFQRCVDLCEGASLQRHE
ncbi:MAG: adenylate/guanylate cyclase domain-containing protein, partial [Betaproteobacteria bacterium]